MNNAYNEVMNQNQNNSSKCMNDKEILTDLLNQEKQLINQYTQTITEASCPNLRSVLSSQFNQVSQDQFKIFETMSERGFYPVKNAQPADVQTAKQDAEQMKTTFNC